MSNDLYELSQNGVFNELPRSSKNRLGNDWLRLRDLVLTWRFLTKLLCAEENLI